MILVKIIFWLIVIYYVFKLLGRFVFPWVLKKLVKKMYARMGVNIDPFMNQQNNTTPNNTSNVNYNTKSQPKRKSYKDDAEDVEFEEIKD